VKTNASEQLKAEYQRLRLLSCDALWSSEVPRFNAAASPERVRLVGVVRAVGVVFSESGTPAQKQMARQWLTGLLSDPAEKVRRYAIAALPKLGSGKLEESNLLALLDRKGSEREDRALAQALNKIGGEATLERGAHQSGNRLNLSLQRVRANVERKAAAGSLTLHNPLKQVDGIRIVLECRSGLTPFVTEELGQSVPGKETFQIVHRDDERIELRPRVGFSLGAVCGLRCFSRLSFPLGDLPPLKGRDSMLDAQAVAALIASGPSRQLMESFTKGTIRYRLDFSSRRAGSAYANAVAEHVFAAAPALLNDPRQALWEVGIRETAQRVRVELAPRFRPDPRFAYRRGDVPAASHPPLAAAMARLARIRPEATERIWDPFCGSGLELAECALAGGGGTVFGTDLSAEAVAVAKLNFAAATRGRPWAEARFVMSDFREAHLHPDLSGLRDLSLIICNPPLGKRVPVDDLHALVRSLFGAAERLLRPGGRLVFINPVDRRPEGGTLTLEFHQKVDVGFAHLYLEKWTKPESNRSRHRNQERKS
jgi:23S rRNA G2445 N2-methylase RlmL